LLPDRDDHNGVRYNFAMEEGHRHKPSGKAPLWSDPRSHQPAIRSGDTVDAAFAPIHADEWCQLAARAHPLSMSRFAESHSPVAGELLFFRGIAGENAAYIGPFGADVIIPGYCSQEKKDTTDANIFEMLWEPRKVAVTVGTAHEVRGRVKYDHPASFSGSLV
jgi:hypothetical protein